MGGLLPAVMSVVHLVRAVVHVAFGDFPLAVLAVFAEAVDLAKVMSVPWLLLAVVRWAEGRGLLLTGTGPLVVLSVVDISERVDLLMVATSERLYTTAEVPAEEVALPTVDPASVETITAPKTSV